MPICKALLDPYTRLWAKVAVLGGGGEGGGKGLAFQWHFTVEAQA